MTATPPPAPDPRIAVLQDYYPALDDEEAAGILTVLDRAAAPDTARLCGGKPGKPMVSGERWPELCPGCPDCQPAPTPDAGYAALAEKARAVGRALGKVDDPNTPLPDPFNAIAPTPSGDAARGKRHQRAVTASVANAYLDEMERLAVALQEARERAEALRADIERLGAARYDNQMDVVYVTLDDGTYLSAALYAAAAGGFRYVPPPSPPY